MRIERDKSLKKYNTFGIDCSAREFLSVTSTEDLASVLGERQDSPLFLLGGGSNMLLLHDIEALVLHIDLKGITVISEDDDSVLVQAMAGENWHEFVMYCISKNYGGVENLSLIPGNVGTAPIQNIGAYGVELKDIFHSCSAIHINSQEENTFDREACEFGYRNSVFKKELKGSYVITSVTFRLTKNIHQLHTSYGAIQQELESKQIEVPSIADVSNAVITIRKSKLPDPSEIGNSGSFFKNPVIHLDAFKEFRIRFPEAPYYEISPTEFKIPAGWLIEQAGFKGKRFGDAGVHTKQALVLVNYGEATGTQIWELALTIQKEVKDKFEIYIEPEVNVI